MTRAVGDIGWARWTGLYVGWGGGDDDDGDADDTAGVIAVRWGNEVRDCGVTDDSNHFFRVGVRM